MVTLFRLPDPLALSPLSQKVRLLLNAAKVDYQSCIQPPMPPRSDLLRLGITHRRIPLLAVGRDIYCDTSLIFDIILNRLGGSANINVGRDDALYEAWGRATSAAALALLHVDKLPRPLLEDRRDFVPLLLRSDFATLALSARAELHSRMTYLEETILADSPYAHGDKLSVADVHIISPIRSALFGLAGMKDVVGFGQKDFPKIWYIINSLPEEKDVQVLSGDEAVNQILQGKAHTEEPTVTEPDPSGLARDTNVTVESAEYALTCICHGYASFADFIAVRNLVLISRMVSLLDPRSTRSSLRSNLECFCISLARVTSRGKLFKHDDDEGHHGTALRIVRQ